MFLILKGISYRSSKLQDTATFSMLRDRHACVLGNNNKYVHISSVVTKKKISLVVTMTLK
jgi:hypothetical protein